ncbi:hypothetical protein AOLI_G00013660 [Acnodon oligacanthus]
MWLLQKHNVRISIYWQILNRGLWIHGTALSNTLGMYKEPTAATEQACGLEEKGKIPSLNMISSATKQRDLLICGPRVTAKAHTEEKLSTDRLRHHCVSVAFSCGLMV